jgi:type II secretory pathway predicted ATPase ExeA
MPSNNCARRRRYAPQAGKSENASLTAISEALGRPRQGPFFNAEERGDCTWTTTSEPAREDQTMASSAEQTRYWEKPFMPLNLRTAIARVGVSQVDFGKALRQSNGKHLSETTVSLWLGRGFWPTNTPRPWLEEQARKFLRDRSSPDAEAADLFEVNKERIAERGSSVSELVGHTREQQIEEPDLTLEPKMLTPAARRHFKLFRDPFNTDPECPEDVFRGPDQQFASESIWEAVRNARLFGLVGESGSGKTTLLDDFKDRVRRESLSVRLIQPMLTDKKKMTARGVMEAIIADIAPGVTMCASSEKLTRQAHELLAESSQAGQYNVVLFEEAHDLNIYALKQLKRFHEFKTGWKRLISIVLIGQPELLVKLGEHATGEAREVARRLEILQLLPLDNELQGYVAHKLARANAKADVIFAGDTYDAVRNRLWAIVKDGPRRGERISMTYPLLVNNLLVAAMNTAAELGAERVDAGLVKGC